MLHKFQTPLLFCCYLIAEKYLQYPIVSLKVWIRLFAIHAAKIITPDHENHLRQKVND